MDGITTLDANIIFIVLLLVRIRALAVGNDHSPVSPSDEGATVLKGDEPSPPAGSASSPAHENHNKGFLFDAFLSFRGEDTRNSFVSHLYNALKGASMSPFMDSRDLGKGEPIEMLLNYIEKSRILLPIFSKRYAESDWCLKEVTKMVEVRNTAKRVDIIPIFLNVEPKDVRRWYKHFKGASGDEIEQWKKALEEATRFHGFTLEHSANGFVFLSFHSLPNDVLPNRAERCHMAGASPPRSNHCCLC